MTDVKLLHISAPECHPQGFFCYKIQVQHTNLGIASPSLELLKLCVLWNFEVLIILVRAMQYLDWRFGLSCLRCRRPWGWHSDAEICENLVLVINSILLNAFFGWYTECRRLPPLIYTVVFDGRISHDLIFLWLLNSLTNFNRTVCVMMLIVIQLVVKFPVISGTRRFIAAYRRARH